VVIELPFHGGSPPAGQFPASMVGTAAMWRRVVLPVAAAGLGAGTLDFTDQDDRFARARNCGRKARCRRPYNSSAPPTLYRLADQEILCGTVLATPAISRSS